jgi:hypothetical protein
MSYYVHSVIMAWDILLELGWTPRNVTKASQMIKREARDNATNAAD